jgi:hypothetical protein
VSDLSIPDLEFRGPDCPFCGEECRYEEGWVCEPCGFSWSSSGSHGERLSIGSWSATLPPCDEEVSPLTHVIDESLALIRDYRYRCVRDHGHDDDHAGVRVDEYHPTDTHSWKS